MQTLANKLRRLLPAESVMDDPLRLFMYGYDGTLYEGEAELAILPETTEQVISAVKAIREADMPIVPRGAATSLSGGPVPVRGGAVFSFTRMDRVLELDYANQRAVVQPGVVNLQFQDILAKDHFFYAPDPASQCVCTLGGNVGENSGGPHCLKYGVTANHILGLKFVLPDGRLLVTGGKALDPPGYDLVGIIVGSEGTFGLVTEITCRVMPMPEAVTTMLAIFDSLDGASQAVSDIIAAGIIPATLEMMDKPMIQAIEQNLHAGYPLDAEAVLIVELDGLSTSMAHQVEQVKAACARNNVRSFQVAEDEEQRTLLWKGRKGAFGAVVNIAPSKICTDISVPRNELPKVLAEVMEISRKWDIPITNVLHAGDGNLHPLLLFDPRDEDQVRRAKEADQEITQLAVDHGGVLTGEHGIGCGKRKYMQRMFGPSELRLMWRIKEVFDPEGLCNPDKVLPDKSGIPQEKQAREATNWVQPESQEEVQALFARATRDSQKVVLMGAGTKSDSMSIEYAPLELSRLNRIISFDPENLTITAECGVTLPQVDEAIAAHGQMLALRPRCGGRATLGGIVSTNDYGPHRLLYGGPRDLVTGIRAALPNGEVVRFGGKCVKNVAGYAVERLLIGSHGSLAAITEITFRTLPRPEACRNLALAIESPSSAEELFGGIVQSGMRPAAVELLNPPAAKLAGLDGWQVLVGLEGLADDVEEMQRRFMKSGNWAALDADYSELWQTVTDLGGWRVVKESCAISDTVKTASELDGDFPVRASLGLGLVFHAVAKRSRSRPALEDTVLDVCRRLKQAFDPNETLPDVL